MQKNLKFHKKTSYYPLKSYLNKLFKVTEVQDVPTWTGCRKVLSLKLCPPTIIGNGRSLPASVTDADVVYNMLINVEKILRNLGQQDQWITVDELVYKLVGHAQLQNITICMGGFHRVKKKHFLRSHCRYSTQMERCEWQEKVDYFTSLNSKETQFLFYLLTLNRKKNPSQSSIPWLSSKRFLPLLNQSQLMTLKRLSNYTPVSNTIVWQVYNHHNSP